MGKQSRLRLERRQQRTIEQRFAATPSPGDPLRILRSLHRDIQRQCGENGRRCWEYLLEMTAHSTGWKTETREAQHLWEPFAKETRFEEFILAWNHEVMHAKATGTPFSEPFGELLEEIESTNTHLGQFFTPMAVVRMTNSIIINREDPQEEDRPFFRALDPACGTGRMLIDALVHHDNLLVNGVDTDLWMTRCAMLNVRLLMRWTSMRVRDPADILRPLRRARHAIAELEKLISNPQGNEDAIEAAVVRAEDALDPSRQPVQNNPPCTTIIGGRAIFIHGDALVVDLDHSPNWLRYGFAWNPPPWQDNLKMRGYPGTYNRWIEAGRPTDEQVAERNRSEIEFDYSMAR